MSNKEEVTVCDPCELVEDLAERIGIHQLYAIVRDMRGEPEEEMMSEEKRIDNEYYKLRYKEMLEENKKLTNSLKYINEERERMRGEIEGLKFALRCNGISGSEVC